MSGYAGYGVNPYGDLYTQRAKQIDALVRQYPSCKGINADRSVFDLPVELGDGKATALRISLPPHFPQERPVLTVLLPVHHSAVDATGRVHSPQVNQWVFGQSWLGDAVAEAVAILQDSRTDTGGPFDPAAAAGYTGRPGSGGAYAAGGPMSQNRPLMPGLSPNSSPSQHRAGPNNLGPPPPGGPATAVAMPDPITLSLDELEKLLISEAAFKEYLANALKKSGPALTLQQIRTSNRQLAQDNLSKQDAINEAKNQLAIVKSSEYSLAKQQFDALYARHQKVMSKLGSGAFKERLENAVSEVDNASNALVASYLGRKMPVEQFVEEYSALRVRYNTLDLKRQAAEML